MSREYLADDRLDVYALIVDALFQIRAQQTHVLAVEAPQVRLVVLVNRRIPGDVPAAIIAPA